MLGLYALSQAPFGSLSYSIYTDSVFESTNLADTPVGGLVFTDSCTEDFISASYLSPIYAFSSSITEDIFLSDPSVIGVAYAVSFVDPFEILDIDETSTQLIAYAHEDFSVHNANSELTDYNIPVVVGTAIGNSDTQLTDYLLNVSYGTEILDVNAGSVGYPVSINEHAHYAAVPSVLADYISALSENFVPNDTPLVFAGFVTSRSENVTLGTSSYEEEGYYFFITENVASADTTSEVTVYYIPISENVVLGDASVGSIGYSVFSSDGIDVTDYGTIAAAFAAQLNENVRVQDIIPYFQYPVSSGWTPINTDIYIPRDSIGIMFGGASFGSIPFSGFVGGNVIVNPGWKDIINN